MTEGDQVVFTISRSGDKPAETVYFSTLQDSASYDEGDYATTSGGEPLNILVSFSSGTTSRTVTINILDDGEADSGERFRAIVQRSSSDPASVYLDRSSYVTINDAPQNTSYSLTPDATSVTEGDQVVFTISRSGDKPAETVYFSTLQDTASYDEGDYATTSGSEPLNIPVSFSSGATSRTVTINILDDGEADSGERFRAIVQRNSSDPASVYLDRSSYVTINDDTPATSYSITPNPATVGEDDGTLTFTITRSGSLPAETVYVSTVKTEGFQNLGDYSGFVDQPIAFGLGETQETVDVSILPDFNVEGNETFGLILQRTPNPSATVYDAKAVFTITDVSPATSYLVSPNPATVGEGDGTLTFTITRSGSLPAETVYVSTVNGAQHGYATNDEDYETTVDDLPLAFSLGVTQETVTVTILPDSEPESNETFGLIVQKTPDPDPDIFVAQATFTVLDSASTGTSDLLVQGNAVTASPSPIAAGNNLTVTYTLANVGPAASNSSTTKIQIKRASDNALLMHQNFSVNALAAGGTRNESHTLTLPSDALDGLYRVYVLLDNFSTAGQTPVDEANDDDAFTSIAIQQPIAATFNIGDRVTATDSLNVRPSPGSTTILVEQNPGERGQIISAPQIADYLGITYTWYEIAWDDGNSGWSIQDYLAPVPTSTNPDDPTGLVDVFVDSSNYDNRPPGQSIDAIVIHTTEDSYSRTIAWFTDPEGLSAHYVIEQDGTITQVVHPDDRAWHATYYNARSIGIEMVGYASDPCTWTKANLDALERLVAALVDQYPDIPIVHSADVASDPGSGQLNIAGIVGHDQVQPWNKSDPGPYFPWPEVVYQSGVLAGAIPVDDISPQVNSAGEQAQSDLAVSFSISSEAIMSTNTAEIELGQSVSIRYTVTDAGGSGLDRIELWRWEEGDWREDDTPNWQKIGKDYDDIPPGADFVSTAPPIPYVPAPPFTDTPESVGRYYYGIHAVDNASNWGTENQPPGPIALTVQPVGLSNAMDIRNINPEDNYGTHMGSDYNIGTGSNDVGRTVVAPVSGRVVFFGRYDRDGDIDPARVFGDLLVAIETDVKPDHEFWRFDEKSESKRTVDGGKVTVFLGHLSDFKYDVDGVRDESKPQIILDAGTYSNEKTGSWVTAGVTPIGYVAPDVNMEGLNKQFYDTDDDGVYDFEDDGFNGLDFCGPHVHVGILPFVQDGTRDSEMYERDDGTQPTHFPGSWSDTGTFAYVASEMLSPARMDWDKTGPIYHEGTNEIHSNGTGDWENTGIAQVDAVLGFENNNIAAQLTEVGESTGELSQSISTGFATSATPQSVEALSGGGIARSVIIPRNNPVLHFDIHFTQPGTGDRLVALINGTEVWSMVGTDYTGTAFQNTGEIDLSAWAGQTVELEIRLATTGLATGEDQAQVWIDNVMVESDGFDFDGSVDYREFSILSDRWIDACTGPSWCGGADMDMSGFVDIGDLRLFAERWLTDVPSISDPNGTIVGWGYNGGNRHSPSPLGSDYSAIAAGEGHSLALKADGTIVGWGSNTWGERNSPEGNDFIAIAAGEHHSLALRADGTVYAWGLDNHGQNVSWPGNDYKAIAAGGAHNLALRTNGSIVGWGLDDNGQATGGPTTNDIIAIAAGGGHSLALRANGTVVVWGSNEYGQLDLLPEDNNNIKAIAAGRYHSLALKMDGSIVGWGYNAYGQTDQQLGNDYTTIAAGGNHSLALKADGSMVGWGYNEYGQANPQPGNTFIAIAGGAVHSLALYTSP